MCYKFQIRKEILQQSRQIYAILQVKIILQKVLKSVTTGYVMLIWKCIPGIGIPEIKGISRQNVQNILGSSKTLVPLNKEVLHHRLSKSFKYLGY